MPTDHFYSPETTDLALDKAIAAKVFGHQITEGPDTLLAVTAGAGSATKLVDLLPVSTDLSSAWQAVTTALASGQADGVQAGALRLPDGRMEFRATFLREQLDGPAPICGADAESLPRAICAALLTLYGQPVGKRVLAAPTRALQ